MAPLRWTPYTNMAFMPMPSPTHSPMISPRTSPRTKRSRRVRWGTPTLTATKSVPMTSMKLHRRSMTMPDLELESGALGLTIEEVLKCEEGIGQIDGFCMELMTGDTALKITAFQSKQMAKFEKTFDRRELTIAGMEPKFGFDENLNIVRVAMKRQYAAVKVLIEGANAVLIITEKIRLQTLEYRLKLPPVELDASDLEKLDELKEKDEFEIVKKQLAESRKRIEELKVEMAGAKAESDARVVELQQTIKDLTQERDKANAELKQAIASGKTLKGSVKAAAVTAEDNARRIEQLNAELTETKAQLTEAAAKKKKLVIAKTEADASLKAKDEKIEELKGVIASPFQFNTMLKKGFTIPTKYSVADFRKTATKLTGDYLTQLLIQPAISSGKHVLEFEVIEARHKMEIGLTDDSGKSVTVGCSFRSEGDVTVKGKKLATAQPFGGWQKGDRIKITADLNSMKVRIDAPNGNFVADWKPRCTPVWFGFYSNEAGASLSIL